MDSSEAAISQFNTNFTQDPQCLSFMPGLLGDLQVTVRVGGNLQANNGEALVQAAAQGAGITVQPDFIVEQYVKEGTLETILGGFEPPPLGIYAILPSNRYLPQRVRVLIEFLASELAQADPESIPETQA